MFPESIHLIHINDPLRVLWITLQHTKEVIKPLILANLKYVEQQLLRAVFGYPTSLYLYSGFTEIYNIKDCTRILFYNKSNFTSLLAGRTHWGVWSFTRTGREKRPFSSAAFILLPPSGSHRAAGGPGLSASLTLGHRLDDDATVFSSARNRSSNFSSTKLSLLSLSNFKWMK